MKLLKYKYKVLYKTFSLLSKFELLDKILPQYIFFPRTFKYNLEAVKNAKKYTMIIKTELEIAKIKQASDWAIKDLYEFDCDKTNFERLKIDYPTELEDICDVETYYNILNRK